MRITHPFHPRFGELLDVVGRRKHLGAEAFLYRDGERLALMPAAWTDSVEPEPLVLIADGRSCFRVDDLLRLSELVRALLDAECK
ncbi:MAG: DUF5372 family protein [Vulcanimicrobiota bacterium]